jgi:Ca-activated chloride channel family protein
MSSQPGFTLEVSQNRYLSPEDGEMHAILTVSGRDLGAASDGPPPEAAVVLIVDCSTSMGWPSSRMPAAIRATVAAVDALRDGTSFAVVAGTHRARTVYPADGGLCPATARTRAEAAKALRRLEASGATDMASWLAMARGLLSARPGAVRHAVLLTDGRNEGDDADRLGAELAACAGLFRCDARGVGDDWEPAELQRITSALGGTADAVRADAELEADFREIMRAAMGRVVPSAHLRFRTVRDVRPRFLRQVFPSQADLTAELREAGARTVELETGPWGDETREYHLCLEIGSADRPTNEERRLARVDLVVTGEGGDPVAVHGSPAGVLVTWTDDADLSTWINPKVGHYAAHTVLKEVVDAGYEALRAGDRGTAAAEWARALDLATTLGNTKVRDRLAPLVEVGADGRARLRDAADGIDGMRARVVSDESALSHTSPEARRAAAPPEESVDCPSCGEATVPRSYCTWCGHTLHDAETVRRRPS